MPAYQYRCSQCGTSFQVRKPMADLDSISVCPECGTPKTERLISNVAFFTSTDGARRAVVGASSCTSCATVGTGCAGCHPR